MTLTSKPTLDTILGHRSIRRFSDQPISTEVLNTILEAGRAASSSSFMQTVHIIRVTDPSIREALRTIGSNQRYIAESPEFLVFCMDFAKHKHIALDAQTDWTEVSLIGAINAGIMAQNVLLAAESLGLGGVYIGCLRNDARQVSELLGLPNFVMPLFGMCLGYPAQDPMFRPRLPLPSIVSENRYTPIDDNTLQTYNETVKTYYKERSNLDLDWAQQVRNTLCTEVRPDILPLLNDKGFTKR